MLILVDDGSSDGSADVCDGFAKADHRIKVIHQKNSGSVEARKRGVFSEWAQCAKYICFCDSDDKLPKNSLDKLIKAAEKNRADCVCGNSIKAYRGIRLRQSFAPPCFSSKENTVYTKQKIQEQLYVSCFGISNYPVSLWAKLYKTELITQASNFPPIVRFMGEDLSVTLRIMPNINRLVIIPDVIYLYNVGGGTSKFNPYMLDDFLSLYTFKKQMAAEYPMPQNTDYLMAVELKNVVMSYLEMCALKGKFGKDALQKEIVRVCSIPEIQSAMLQPDFSSKEPNGIRKAILDGDVDKIEAVLAERIKSGRLRRIVKSILK